MSDEAGARQKQRGTVEKTSPPVPYTTKDFQLEVLSKLDEMQDLAGSLQDAWGKLEAVKEQRLLKFDMRTLIALGAVAVSMAGYVIQDARNTARQDNDIETTKSRVLRLEQIAATNTEARIRTEAQLGELREGQAEIKTLIQAHDSETRRVAAKK